MPPPASDLPAKVMDLLLDAVCVVDSEDRYVFVGGNCEAIFGYTPDEMIGRSMYDFMHPEDRNRTADVAANVASGTPYLHFRNRYVRKDGSVVHLMWAARRLDEQLRLGVARDVTALARAESLQAAVYAIAEAAHANGDLPALFRRIHAIVAALLPVGGFVVGLRDETGKLEVAYAADEDGPCEASREAVALCTAVGARDESLPATLDAATGAEWLGATLGAEGATGTFAIRHANPGARYSDRDRELLQHIAAQVATAVAHHQAAMRLRHLALHDVLTGLPNRALFYDRLTSAMTRARRNNARVGVLFMDLDGFKQVNDRYGHVTGDTLLREVAQRLKLCVRDSDTVSRVGGDEFVVVLDGIRLPAEASMVAEKIRESLGDVFQIGNSLLNVVPSLGIALYPDDGLDSDTLVRHADKAMYADKHDKGEGGNAATVRGTA